MTNNKNKTNRQSQKLQNFFEFLKAMGENLEIGLSKFEKMQKGYIVLGIIVFIACSFLDYYSGLELVSFIRSIKKAGYIYFFIRSIVIFIISIIKFQLIYKASNRFFTDDGWKKNAKYKILFLVLLQCTFAMMLYPLGAYEVLIEVWITLLFYLALNEKYINRKNLAYIVITFVSIYIALRFFWILIYNLVSDVLDKTKIVFYN